MEELGGSVNDERAMLGDESLEIVEQGAEARAATGESSASRASVAGDVRGDGQWGGSIRGTRAACNANGAGGALWLKGAASLTKPRAVRLDNDAAIKGWKTQATGAGGSLRKIPSANVLGGFCRACLTLLRYACAAPAFAPLRSPRGQAERAVTATAGHG